MSNDRAEATGFSSLMNQARGTWAGPRLAQAALSGEPMDSQCLRTLDTLRHEEWKSFDQVLVEEAQITLKGVADLIGAGLTKPIPNSLGKTVHEYEKISDMGPASVSLDGISRTENDVQEIAPGQIPIPITHKDWRLNLRNLVASRERGEALDTTNARNAGRRVSEMAEQMLFQGGKTFGGLPIYGYMTHPNRNTVAFGTNGQWDAVAKTGADFLADVLSMITAAQNVRMNGPYWLYVSRSANIPLDNDFKALGTQTIRQRLLTVDGLQKIQVVDQLPNDNIILVQPTSDVVEWLQGETLQTVQWDIEGGFWIAMKAWQIGVPLIKADIAGRSGVVHMS